MSSLRPAVAALFAIAVISPAAAPAVRADGLEEVLNGKEAPVLMALKDLTPEWRRVVVREPSTRMSEQMSKMMAASMMGGSASASNGMEAMMFANLFGGGAAAAQTEEVTYYTRGKVLTLGAETFLVAYRPDRRGVNLSDLFQQAVLSGDTDTKPDMKKMLVEARVSPESRLSLALLNVRNLGSLSGVRPVDVAAEVADLSRDNAFFEAIVKADEKEQATPVEPVLVAEPGVSLATHIGRALTQQDGQLSAPGNHIQVEERSGGVLVLKGHVKTAALQARAANVARRALAEMETEDGTGVRMRVVNQLAIKAGP